MKRRIIKMGVAAVLIALVVLLGQVQFVVTEFGNDTLVGFTMRVENVDYDDYVCIGRLARVVGKPGDLLKCNEGVLECNEEIISRHARVTPRELKEYCVWDGHAVEFVSDDFVRFFPVNERVSTMLLCVVVCSVLICVILR